MFVSDVDGLETLSNKLPVSSHVRVSLAQVVVIVDHNSADETFVELVNDVVGFEIFVNDISVGYYDVQSSL